MSSSFPQVSRFTAKPALERFLLQLPSDEGADFFDTLTEAIGRATGVTYVVVAEPTEQPRVRARTLSVWGTARAADFAYDRRPPEAVHVRGARRHGARGARRASLTSPQLGT